MWKPLSDNDLATDCTDFTDDVAEPLMTMRLDFQLSAFVLLPPVAKLKSDG
jgi:hypothetical protein